MSIPSGLTTLAQALYFQNSSTIARDMPTKTTKQKRALFLTADKFEDFELFVPYFRLLEAGVDVDIAGPAKGMISGEHGYGLKISKTFSDVDPSDYDLLVIPGGFPDGAPLTVRNDKRAVAIAKQFMTDKKSVASICHGPWTLASADVVKGRRVTSFWHDGVPEDLKTAGAIWKDESVVVDGNLVTSRWPMDLPDFCREMMRLLKR